MTPRKGRVRGQLARPIADPEIDGNGVAVLGKKEVDPLNCQHAAGTPEFQSELRSLKTASDKNRQNGNDMELSVTFPGMVKKNTIGEGLLPSPRRETPTPPEEFP